MRNFPHQINQISKISGSLRIASELLSRGENIGDDGIFGYAVLRAGIYNFRGLSTASPEEIEEAIRRERRKLTSNQGPRTFARDLRRTLQLLGFIEHNASGYSITQSGERISTLPNPPDEEATSIWANALINMVLQDAADPTYITHPARNMLRMVSANPDLEKQWLAFALDMFDDSDTELARVLALQELPFEAALQTVGASDYTAANAVKIIPSLLHQLDLININNQICNITPAGQEVINPASDMSNTTHQLVRPRNRREGVLITNPEDIPTHELTPREERTTEEQLHSSALLDERTSQHQELVKKVVGMLSRSANVDYIRVTDDAFDILASIPERDEVLLIEAKTIRNDSLVQGRNALGQLLFYEYFDIQPIAGTAQIVKIAAFDRNPGEQVREFLLANGTLCLVVSSEQTVIPDGYEDYFIPD